ncbi:MAG: penicillin-binding protein 1C [Comamonas sp.]
MPTFEQVRSSFAPSETWVHSREGEVLQRLRTDFQVRRGQWLSLQDTSAALRLALVVSEDQRFYAHSGVDWKAVSAAAWGNLWNQKTRGASTLTMQLAGLLDADAQSRQARRSLGQKVEQAWSATQLEQHWRKDQILEAYLNLVPFRGELVGLDALSRSLFGKAAHGLDGIESAIAVALIRGPNASPAVVAQRACGVWQAVQAWPQAVASAPTASCSALDWRVAQALRARQWPAQEGIAPHWAQRVLREQSSSTETVPQQITTTVSAPIQRLAVAAVQHHLRELQGRNVEDAAAVVLDNASGQVLAWVGSSGSLSQAEQVDGVLAWRQPGSTLKPFLYAQALEEGRLTAASLLEDSPAQIATPSGLYIPQNYDRRFKGWVSVRAALGGSLNVPAVKTLVMVTPDAFFSRLRALGIPLRESGGYYGYSLALGSAEMPLLHLTNAYRVLANQGRYTPVAFAALPSAGQAVDSERQVLAASAAFIVGDILADAQARASTFGLDSVLRTRFWTAVKTGTSKDMRDNWAIGWSSRYTVGVWVGNASGQAMHHVSGSSGAAPIWADIMAGLHAQHTSTAPVPPQDVVATQLRYVGAAPGATVEPARQEWFVAGTQQTRIQWSQPAKQRAQASATGLRIVQPSHGSVLALDPDIPPQRQRLRLQASSGGGQWWMDGKRIGAGQLQWWFPMPGRHVLQLRDGNGEVLDEVRIEVRGAGLKDAAQAVR